MLYLPIIDAIETQLRKDKYLRELKYYRFSIPSSSVRSPFICIPFTQTVEYTSHARPCITDEISNSCIGNFRDLHYITIPILIGAARHKKRDADEVLDIIQDAVMRQVNADRYMNGAVRWVEGQEMIMDNFFEISPSHKGSMFTVEVKYIDDPNITEYNWIEEVLTPTYTAVVNDVTFQ